jgi:hypothetical protein
MAITANIQLQSSSKLAGFFSGVTDSFPQQTKQTRSREDKRELRRYTAEVVEENTGVTNEY